MTTTLPHAAGRALTYAALDERVNRAANVLSGLGVGRGDRVAILSENRPEYIELELACAKLGAILACQNWRLAPPELRHCIGLVSAAVVVVSERHAGSVDWSSLPASRCTASNGRCSFATGASTSST